ncbi:MAG TPA: hypothetical protein VHL11_18030, partial [Phototrophicaceae bacterium]|nr:hypothetical protein [Phototrophicaceae bacterium]
IEQFEGTTLLVTHDRYLVDRLATQIWHLEYGHLRVFKGSYQEYLELREKERLEGKIIRAEFKREQRAQRKSSTPEVAKLEAQIHSVESSLAELATLIERAKTTTDIERLGTQYAESQAKLDELMQQWEAVAEQTV